MKVHKTTGTSRAAGFGALLILAVVLGILFWRSFLPDYVHFSNDGPLGQQNSDSARLPAAFLGNWSDAYDIGAPGGTWPGKPFRPVSLGGGSSRLRQISRPVHSVYLGFGRLELFPPAETVSLGRDSGRAGGGFKFDFFFHGLLGVAPQEIAIGMDYFALALVVSITAETALPVQLARLALAGLCVGMNVMEAADIGAIFSLFVSAFVVVKCLNQETGGVPARLGRGIWSVAVVAIFAGLIACSTVVSLVGTQISGVAGTGQDTQTKQEKWDWATEWSLPKTETLGLFVPGLFGYKMDTPANMAPEFAGHYVGGNYWGGMGRDPLLDPYFDAGRTGTPQSAQWRQTSGTNYCGMLVVLLAVWAAAQSFRPKESAFSDTQRRYIWFWSAVVILSLLFAWGRFSIFYALLYKLPYFSTIRSPTKFLIVLSWGIVVLFAYGIDGFSRRHLAPVEKLKVVPANPTMAPPKPEPWWAALSGFDRKWIIGCMVLVVITVLGWLVYAGEKKDLRHYLASVGFPSDPDGDLAGTVAAFSIGQAEVFVVLFALAAGLVILVVSGVLAGRGRVAGVLLGALLVLDMGRANLPYITYWNYKQKYEIDDRNPGASTNPIINLLRDKYYDHRVELLPFGGPGGTELFTQQLYPIEWVQHQFPYYNIQTKDLFQRPRVPADIQAYENAVYFRHTQDSIPMLVREWQLTNTRYLLGAAGFLDALNSLDPQHRFRIVERFNMGPKPPVTEPTKLEEITSVPDANGSLALFEFAGALPRVKLYSNWQVSTNDDDILKSLASPGFDPERTVLVSTPAPGLAVTATNDNGGSVEFKNYAPTKIILSASTLAPTVLLYNSKYDSDWQVTVDGQPRPLLRCNFIMRGVFLSPGAHTVEFRYAPPNGPLHITLAAYGVGILLAGFLLVSGGSKRETGENPPRAA